MLISRLRLATSGLVSAVVMAASAQAAVLVPDQNVAVSGKSVFAVEMTVTEYFAPQGRLPSARQIGDKVVERFELDFTGFVDDTRTVFPFTDAQYDFSNGWTALVNGPPTSTFFTSCGFVIDYCIGDLSTAPYEVVDSSYDLSFSLVIEGADPAFGDPANFFFTETVILQNQTDGSDFHFFEASGRSVPVSVIPLPASLPLLAGALAVMGLAGFRRRIRAHILARPT